MTNALKIPALAALPVPRSSRNEFLEAFFGPHLVIAGESLVCTWMERLCKDYKRGEWNFYRLTNGGFYMAPDCATRIKLATSQKWCENELSADAAGIVATLKGLSSLANHCLDYRVIELYQRLKEFASLHEESHAINMAL